MPTAKQHATNIVRTLREREYQAYLVGGCVRDLVLSREPADYDVATDATPDQVMGIFPRSYGVGAQFGVVLIPVDGYAAQAAPPQPNGRDVTCYVSPAPDTKTPTIEVATFRSDIGYSDGRHPDQVRYTTSAKEDVQR